MPRNTYTLGGITFTTQKQVKDHFKWIKTGASVPINKGHSDFAFLRDLFMRSPHQPADPIMLIEFAYHESHHSPDAVNRGVILTLAGGTKILYPSAVYGLETTDQEFATNPWPKWEKIKARKLKQRMRTMTRWQIDQYRDCHKDGLCEQCGAPGEDVDHAGDMGFEAIANLWLSNMDVFDLDIVDETPDGGNPCFANDDLHGNWQDYHMRYAEYQLLCKKCHRKETARRRSAA